MTVQAGTWPSGLSRDQLIALRRVWSSLPTFVVNKVSTLGLRRRRGRMAGRNRASSELCKKLPPIESAVPSAGSKQSATLAPSNAVWRSVLLTFGHC